jgi:hypothetical protein
MSNSLFYQNEGKLSIPLALFDLSDENIFASYQQIA